jgi:ubiquitin carboxyl-terminal hydrolase 20/33
VSDVKKFNDIFQGPSQQDAQEFLRCILDKLHDELTYPRKYPDLNQILPNIPIQDEKLNKTKSVQLPQQTSSKSSNGTSKDISRSSNPKAVTTSSLSYASSRSSTSSRSLQSSENSSLVENTEITPARVTTPSIISDLFEGTLESRVRCLSCRKEYIKEDKFFDLSIPIDKKSKIIDDQDDKSSKDKDGGVLGSFVDSIGGWLRYDSKTCAFCVLAQSCDHTEALVFAN